jgi:hypothetical protein
MVWNCHTACMHLKTMTLFSLALHRQSMALEHLPSSVQEQHHRRRATAAAAANVRWWRRGRTGSASPRRTSGPSSPATCSEFRRYAAAGTTACRRCCRQHQRRRTWRLPRRQPRGAAGCSRSCCGCWGRPTNGWDSGPSCTRGSSSAVETQKT